MYGRRDRKEAGTALLSVLLILGVVSALMVSILDGMMLSVNVSQNAQDSTIARYQANAAEALALEELKALLQRNSGALANVGNWNGTPFTVPLDRGQMTLTISDYTNCFNVNALVKQDFGNALRLRGVAAGLWPRATDERRVSLAMQRQFIALLEALDFSSGDARRIAASIIDWLDSDRVPSALGAEDGLYLSEGDGYRAPNQLIRTVSELLDVRGITPDIYARLKPWLCAHPSTEPTPMNVNLLQPGQAPLLMMLMPGTLTRNAAQRVLADIPALGWRNTADFWEHPSLVSLKPGSAAIAQTVTKSQYFKLNVFVSLDRGDAAQTAIIQVAQSGPQRVARSWQNTL